MSKTLRGVHLDEFSLVRGTDLQPANPEAVTAFYKAKPTAKESNMAEKTNAATPRPSLAKAIGDAVRAGLAPILKAQATRTSVSTYSSESHSTDTFTDDSASGAAEPADGNTTIIITDAIEKTSPAPSAPVTEAAPDGTEAVVKALEPITQAVVNMDSRLAKLESRPAGSRVIKSTGGSVAEVIDNSGAKFPEFTKYLSSVSGISAGQKLSKATITAGGWSYGLSFAEGGNFIDYVVDQSVLLKLCRTIKMKDKKQPIDKIGLGGKVLVKGTPGTDPGDTVSVSGPTQVLLDAQEILAIVSIGDDTLEDNIEGEAFVQHLLGMVARSAANELEQAAMLADTSVADTGILDRFDGWYKLAKANGAHVIEAMTDTDRYWPGTAAAKATKMIKALPSKYRQDFRQLAVLLANDLYLDYNDELATKGYTDAWQAITGMTDLPVRGIKNVRVPMLSTSMSFNYSAAPYTDGTIVMLTSLQNLLFGIHRDIKIEPYRKPRNRATDYILSMRCDAKIENGDAIAIYDHAKVR